MPAPKDPKKREEWRKNISKGIKNMAPEKRAKWRKGMSESRKGNQNRRGTHQSEETKRKISESLKKMTPAERAERSKRRSEFLKGNQYRLGTFHSEETKRKISEAHKGEKHHYFGKHLSVEHRRKLSEANQGQIPWNKGKTGIYSEETLKLMRLGAQLGGLLGGMRGKHHTEEAKRKMSEAQRGKHHTEETKRKMSEVRKGEKNPNFGKSPSIETREKIKKANRGKHYSPCTEFSKGIIPWNRGKTGVYSEETRRKMSENNPRIWKGRHLPEATRRKISEAQKGKYISPEIREKLSKAHKIKDGLTPLAEIIRHTVTYKLWRMAVFQRDKFQCQDCGKIGGRLNAHHTRSFVKLLEDFGVTSFGQAIRTEEL